MNSSRSKASAAGRALGISAVVLVIGVGCNDEKVGDKTIEDARALTGKYRKALKGELQAAMGQGGPPAAIAVCNEKAPRIGKQVTRWPATKGWEVNRTALRVRNPQNRPSALEEQGLQKMKQQLAEGGDPKKVHFTAVDSDEFLFMQPIMTGELCLTCHGKEASLSSEVKTKLQALYPDDEATGFSAGDLRGAFVVRGPLDD